MVHSIRRPKEHGWPETNLRCSRLQKTVALIVLSLQPGLPGYRANRVVLTFSGGPGQMGILVILSGFVLEFSKAHWNLMRLCILKSFDHQSLRSIVFWRRCRMGTIQNFEDKK